MNTYTILFYISNILGYLPLLLYFLFKGNFATKNFKGLLTYLIFVAFSSFYELIFSYFLKVNVEIWFKVYTFLDFILIVFLFSGQKNRPSRYFFWIFAFLYLVVFAFFTLTSQEIHYLKQDSFFNLLMTFFVISYSIIWFYKNFKLRETNSLLELPFFYFLSGLLFYYTGIIFLSLLSESIINSSLDIYDYWVVNICFLILFRISLVLAVWKGRIN